MNCSDKSMNLLNNISESEKLMVKKQLLIETRRLKLRPLLLSELIDINTKNYDELDIQIEKESLISSTKNAIGKKIIKMEKVKKSLQVWYTYWLIIDKETGIGLGFVGFKGMPDAKGYVELGYSISPLHRRKGLMTEAVKAIIGWAGNEKSCKGILAYALKSNDASNKVLVNCGFKSSSFDEYIKSYTLQLNSI